MLERPAAGVQHLCADAGSKGEPVREAVQARGDLPHVKQRKEEAAAICSRPAGPSAICDLPFAPAPRDHSAFATKH